MKSSFQNTLEQYTSHLERCLEEVLKDASKDEAMSYAKKSFSCFGIEVVDAALKVAKTEIVKDLSISIYSHIKSTLSEDTIRDLILKDADIQAAVVKHIMRNLEDNYY